ncbi:MAG: elongation factor G [Gammaproteobacteria bacterium]|nr:elongation factor G [Gammaproteobacteria bacterium]
MTHETNQILNVALIGSGGAGKTLLSEAILHAAKVTTTKGSVDAGTTVSDYLPREKSTQHSFNPTFLSFSFNNKHCTVVDTPGFHDFVGRTLSVLPSVETAVLVVDATAGIDTSTRRLFAAAGAQGRCRAIVINKIDADNIDLESLVDQIQQVVGSECLPINLPAEGGSKVVDCFGEVSEVETDIDDVASAHEKIIDQIVEVDEELMELYLEGEEDLPEESVRAAFGSALRDGHLIPIFFTSAHTDVGVNEFLDTAASLLPSPAAGNHPTFTVRSAKGERELVLDQDSSKPLLGQAVKIAIDPFRGRMAIVRIHQGTLKAGSQVFVGDDRKPTKVPHIYRLVGEEQVEIKQALAGDICALPRMETSTYNCVLHDAKGDESIRAPSVDVPTPVFGRAIRFENDNEAQKISEALQTIAIEDPSFRVVHVAALNETVIRGLGELHLREVLQGVEAQHGIKVATEIPSIEYKETITAAAEGHNRHKKQTGGAGQFGEVYLRIEPIERGGGFEFVDKVVGGVIPGQFIPAVEKGVKQILDKGAISGHELQDVRVTVYDGKHHPVDSKEIAFVQAGKKAFLDAVAKARPIVMEPVVSVNMNVPSDCMGDVTGDFASMGGIVSGSTVLQDSTTDISGQVPLRELQQYHARLSSITGGKGSYTMEFSHYAAVQPQLQKELASGFVAIEED